MEELGVVRVSLTVRCFSTTMASRGGLATVYAFYMPILTSYVPATSTGSMRFKYLPLCVGEPPVIYSVEPQRLASLQVTVIAIMSELESCSVPS